MSIAYSKLHLPPQPVHMLAIVALVFSLFLPPKTVSAWQGNFAAENILSMEDCIAIALENQPSIQAQKNGYAAAVETRNIASSQYHPQIGFQTQFTHLNEARTVDIDNVFTDDIAGAFSDAAAFFQIARQAGTDAANAALDNPDSPIFPGGPSFNSASQAAGAALPDTIQVGLLGQNFLTTQTQLVQPLWTGGKIDARNEQARLGVRAAGLEVDKTKYQVAFNVSRAYLSVLLAEELYQAVIDATDQASATEQLVVNLVKNEDEFISTADMYRIRSLRLLFEEQQITFRVGRARAYAALKLAMGLDQTNEFTVAEQQLPRMLRQIEWDAIRQIAIERHPDLARSQIGVQIAQQEVSAAQAEFRPDVALFGSLNTVVDSGGFPNPNNPEEWAVGFAAQIPIYTGGRRQAQVRRASHIESQQSQIRNQVAQAVIQEARDAFLEYEEMGQRLELAEQAVKAGEQTLGSLDALYNLKIEDKDLPDHFEERITARLLLLTAQTSYNKALFSYNLALSRLKLVTASDEIPGSIQMQFSDNDDDRPFNDDRDSGSVTNSTTRRHQIR